MQQNGAHIIAVGNEKGGSGKSTTALHLAVYLLHQGHRVATIDVDSRQQTLTRYVGNRRATIKATGRKIPMPKHVHLPTAWGDSVRENQRVELDIFTKAVDRLRSEVDYVVIDTPGFDGNLARLAHGFADTLITPINDSMIDLDVLARIDVATGEPIETSPYSRNVQRARTEHLARTGIDIDWVLVRNRISNLGSRNASDVQDTVQRLAKRLGCRVADGIAERVIFRSLFPIGMTVFDPLEASPPSRTGCVSRPKSRIRSRQTFRPSPQPNAIPDRPISERSSTASPVPSSQAVPHGSGDRSPSSERCPAGNPVRQKCSPSRYRPSRAACADHRCP
jgi:chromosome partitioning protein